MRLSYRLNLSLVAGVAVTSLAFTLYQTIVETGKLRADALQHAVVIAESLEKPVEAMVMEGKIPDLQGLVNRFHETGGPSGIIIYDAQGTPLAVTSGFVPPPPASSRPIFEAMANG